MGQKDRVGAEFEYWGALQESRAKGPEFVQLQEGSPPEKKKRTAFGPLFVMLMYVS